MHTIENILNEYSKRNINLFAYLKIAQKWNIIIGETLSKICYPSFYKNGILTLTVADSVWANEISMNRLNIFKNIKKETDIIVSELRTRVGEIENEENINSIDKNIYDNQNISKNEISEKHKNWILEVIKESNIDDKKIEEIFYRILENVKKEDKDAN
ncbi:DUF721 domain-containing protein [Brachyspira aalborgi]|jgi:hypothetical protein|uniref:DUF721 domain-containing protein n=1 Tax=Brachyspira aalborgi TaxID=29522 RepID=A0ABY3KDN5_9SPIR|nr:DUF721 domain-containing protein [Brachyspira aalborgi]MBS4762710.1 DUF721 domain-containing protein [Brachyspira sp.]TXJ34597.1 DUF721 domain-containing protein [Brachyspira aalborgi]TXJ46066.1 DUF721 domain-containing protein [Brachyspira aalborgi]CCY75269.1 putative uncharacterized protein [Brachyspira sp. CAG:700]